MSEALVVKSKWDEEFKTGLLQIVEQKYRGLDFFKGENRFKSPNNIIIYSDDYPEMAGDTLCVRGDCIDCDNQLITIKDYFVYNKVLEAIKHYNQATSKPVDYLELHRKLWMKLAETGNTCKNIYAAEIAREAGIPSPKGGCFLCEETIVSTPQSSKAICENCKGYWGFSARKCLDKESYYNLWIYEENIDLRKALARRIANNIKS